MGSEECLIACDTPLEISNAAVELAAGRGSGGFLQSSSERGEGLLDGMVLGGCARN
jgi:hypothetical protein